MGACGGNIVTEATHMAPEGARMMRNLSCVKWTENSWYCGSCGWQYLTKTEQCRENQHEFEVTQVIDDYNDEEGLAAPAFQP